MKRHEVVAVDFFEVDVLLEEIQTLLSVLRYFMSEKGAGSTDKHDFTLKDINDTYFTLGMIEDKVNEAIEVSDKLASVNAEG